MPSDLPQPFQYLLLRTTPPADELTLRRALQTALNQAFGLTAAGTHVDVLWVQSGGDEGTDVSGRGVVRVDNGDDATRVLASIVSSSASPRLELIKSSTFLPSFLVDDAPL
ncbi:hypothetical protein C8R43DRAFT_1062509 [Mycena crocata]|nr:hypothetical protein C8R43DRAFT_1062509 [Mycena crocata]